MISINKKYILFLAMAMTSWFARSTTLTIPQETIANQEVSLFVLVEDQEVLKAGFFELSETEQMNKICNHEFYDVKEATLDLDGTEVAIFDSEAPSLEDGSIIYFEIDPNVTVVKALVVSNSLLDEVVVQFTNLEMLDDEDDFDFSFDSDMFGEDLESQRESVVANQTASAKHFSFSQIAAIVQIAALVGVDATKRFCSNMNNRAKRYARWLAGY